VVTVLRDGGSDLAIIAARIRVTLIAYYKSGEHPPAFTIVSRVVFHNHSSKFALSALSDPSLSDPPLHSGKATNHPSLSRPEDGFIVRLTERLSCTIYFSISSRSFGFFVIIARLGS